MKILKESLFIMFLIEARYLVKKLLPDRGKNLHMIIVRLIYYFLCSEYD